MRKFCLTLGTVIAVSAAPALAGAQQVQPWGVGVAGGAAIPQGDMRSVAGNGVTLQGSLGFTAPVLPLGMRADVMYTTLPHVQGYRFTEFGGLVNGSVGIPMGAGNVRPYVIGGIGAMNHNAPTVLPNQPAIGEGGTHFAWAAGGGLQFNVAGRALNLEARYLDSGEGRRTIPVTLGLQF